MLERDLQPGQLTPAVIAEFRLDCLAMGRRKIPSVKSFDPLLRFLREEGVLGEPPEPESAVERLVVEYRRWLVASGDWLRRRSFAMRSSLAGSWLHASATVPMSRLDRR